MDESTIDAVILFVVCGCWLGTALLLYRLLYKVLGMSRKNAESFATILSTAIWLAITVIGCVLFRWGVEVPVATAVLIVTSAS